jgi:hypothetical protein
VILSQCDDAQRAAICAELKTISESQRAVVLDRIDHAAAVYVDAWARQSRMSASEGAARIARAATALRRAAESLDLFTRARASVLLGGDFATILANNSQQNAWLGDVLRGVAVQARQSVSKSGARHAGNPAIRAFVSDLAAIFENATGRRAGASVNPSNGKVGGPFVRFVLACNVPVTAMFPMIRAPTGSAIRVMLRSRKRKI